MTAWPTAMLGDCCDIVSGATPKTGVPEYWGGTVAWATPKDLSQLDGPTINDTPRKLTDAGLHSCGATVLPAGSVLLSSRAPIGHVAINGIPMATNQGFKSLIPKAGVTDARYLYHWLRANRTYLDSLGSGATFKEISKRVVEKISVPLPPIEEQRRLADELDQVNELRTKRRTAIALLDELTQSIFLDMFGDPARNPMDWTITEVRHLLSSATYGTSAKAALTGDIPVLRMNNIKPNGEVDLTDLKYMDRASLDERHMVRSGDVLFNRTNSADLVGKTGIYRSSMPAAYAGYLVRARVNDQNHPEYLAAFMNTAYAKLLLKSMCKSIVGMANINAREFQSIRIAQPPLALQEEFAARIGRIEALKATHRTHLAALDELFASLQDRAFSGEPWHTDTSS